MNALVRTSLAAVVLCYSIGAAAPVFALDGPFQVKNQFPLFIPADQPSLEPAAVNNSLSVGLSHSSVFVMQDSAAWSAHLDLELTELDLRYRMMMNSTIELGIDIPFLRATAGFMDRPLSWYHRAFGFPDYGRSTRPNNQFLYAVNRNNLPVIIGENDRTGIGDIRLQAKKQVTSGDTAISVMADLELPTGNARIGYGNGSVDAGIGALMDQRINEDALWFMNLGAVFPGDLKAYQTIDLRSYGYAGTGIEYAVRPDLTVLGQVSIQTSPYPRTGISQVDTAGILLVLGGRYYSGKSAFELSLTEDPNTSGAPDFILNFTWKKKL